MRQDLLLLIVLVLALTALVKPRLGLFGYLWFALMRPDILSWSVSSVPYSNILAMTTLAGSIRYVLEVRVLFANSIVRWFFLLQGIFLLSVFFAVRPELTYVEYNLFIRVSVMAMLIPIFVRNVKDMKILLIVLALSIGALGVKFGLWGLLQGGARFSSGMGNNGLISDNNCLALALAMAVPMLWYVRSLLTSQWMRLATLGMLFSSIAAIVMTHSRGGAVSLVVAFVPIILRSQRKLGIVLLLAVLSAPALYMVRDSYFARLESITDYDSEVSAVSRIDYAKAAIRMWKDYPLIGVGFGSANYTRMVSRYLGRDDKHVVHNTYLQILADSGIFAVLVYSAILFGTILWLYRSARRLRERVPGMEIYPLIIQSGIVAFAAGSTFLSRVNFDYWWMLLMAAAAWMPIERQLLAEADAQSDAESSLETSPVKEEVYAYQSR